jgi:hypothetical protein
MFWFLIAKKIYPDPPQVGNYKGLVRSYIILNRHLTHNHENQWISYYYSVSRGWNDCNIKLIHDDNITYFYGVNNNNIQGLKLTLNIKYLGNLNLGCLRVLCLSHNKIKSCTGLNLPLLNSLNMKDNNMTEFYNNNLPKLRNLNLSKNLLPSLDVKSFAVLRNLNVNFNFISKLDLTENKLIKTVMIEYNRLQELNCREANTVLFTKGNPDF